MNDYMLINRLRGEGFEMHDDHELIHKFKEFMRHENAYKHNRDYMFDEEFYEHDSHIHPEEKHYRRGYMMNTMSYLNENHAKEIVSKMYHKDKDEIVRGEHFSMHKAEEVYNKYKHALDDDVTVEDVYIALNAQYHDYCKLFKSWFGMPTAEEKIIASALVFWFKDPDYTKGSKVRNYFDI